ncbi:Predicted flavoprotein CzcO associated with the cation diffusion facilitator CzcD [Friedmanniella luteola]|uniref:Predicted flavoprotein CzcO associated with the cation diffusion facilitator CzcD n=1 Tax=Friedmanniella luteola TaxID=546871 RepID=A0A1H1SGX8_9ACTN|nr:NAD(P)-binding domain-containing protein [Friedmanniella luteola]SDS47227.1 Predicted flavoprotein CzcO associated with the cation diffusion facilitator CzcD [Friedmanniella luteola]
MDAVLSTVVLGAGQAGLSTAHHLARLGLSPGRDLLVLDADTAPGGAWQHRWDTLTMADVHGIATLPDQALPSFTDDQPANVVVPAYFADYERRYRLAVRRPVRVDRVEPAGPLLRVRAGEQAWLTRTLVNATGTWQRPFIPVYPGAAGFRGRQLHTHDYRGPGDFAGQHVVVVGGGASAVQLLAELSAVASTTWVTRRPPVWRDADFTPEAGRAAVALVEERVRQGLPPASVVSVTGLALRAQEQGARERGVYVREPMFARLTPTGVAWPDGREQRADAVLWATGFRPDVTHLAPLHLRSAAGGIQLDGTTAVRDPRVQLVGYGPSASTIGANRAGRAAAVAVLARLRQAAA